MQYGAPYINVTCMKCCNPKKKTTREDFKQQARICKALANEARLMIIECLRDCECSVTKLTEAVGLDQSTVSKHLSALLSVGIVENRKEGNVVFYRLATPCVLDIFCCIDNVKEKK